MKKEGWKQLLKSKRFYALFSAALLAIAVTVLSALFASNPDFTETYIARGWYRIISQPLSWFFGLFPFSMAEVLIIAAIVSAVTYLIVCIVRTVKGLRRKGCDDSRDNKSSAGSMDGGSNKDSDASDSRGSNNSDANESKDSNSSSGANKEVKGSHSSTNPWKPMLNFLTLALCVASGLYSLFYAFWGWNFSRHSLEENLQYQVQESSEEELAELCRELAGKINELRPQFSENEDGVMQISGSKTDLAKRAAAGYEALADTKSDTIDYKGLFGGTYCQPQYLLTSTAFCYMGITGIFIPYTFEANVNGRTPDCSMPHTMMHEMAHQQGFPREDEANFVAFLACRAHEDVDFQYSGYYIAFVYSINALFDHDADLAREIYATVDAGYRRDAAASNAFWDQFEGPVEEVATAVNNSYLQANGQDDGVHSYGRMVDWLLAERRARLGEGA